ncbi:MAG: hypothetical protein HDR41_04100 [Lactobacillus sp.]|nr:hypothetical protein [Lactobacillus sp.]
MSNNFMTEIGVQVLGLVLGFVFTAVVGYMGKHHYVIKQGQQQIDVTQAIMDTIKEMAPWAVKDAAAYGKAHGLEGADLKQYATSVIEYGLTKLPFNIGDPKQYEPLIGAGIEAAYAGAKIAKEKASEGEVETLKIEDVPEAIQPEEIENIEPVANETITSTPATNSKASK